jgi:predicted Rossmann-fold nucleotide-binding protein
MAASSAPWADMAGRQRPHDWPHHPAKYRVTNLRSARIGRHARHEGAKKLAAELTGMGCDILTGGGPGMMQAANEGRGTPWIRRGAPPVGINIELPFRA